MLHRFVSASAFGRYQALNHKKNEEAFSMDIALPRNEKNWFEILPKEIDDLIELKLYYGHLFVLSFRIRPNDSITVVSAGSIVADLNIGHSALVSLIGVTVSMSTSSKVWRCLNTIINSLPKDLPHEVYPFRHHLGVMSDWARAGLTNAVCEIFRLQRPLVYAL